MIILLVRMPYRKMKMKIIYLLFIQVLPYVAPFVFEDPGQPGVKFVEDSGTFLVKVDEDNNGGRTTVIRIVGVNGELQLITSYMQDTGVIEARIEPGEQDSSYVVTVDLRDYEQLIADDVDTAFYIGIQEEEIKYFTLYIQNMDDESPTLEGHSCFMDEEEVIDISNSRCQFNISDPDGWLSGVTFALAGDLGNIFELKYEEIPEDTELRSYVYLVLKEGQKLDYETTNIYHIPVETTDAAGHSSNPQIATLTVLVQDQLPVWTNFEAFRHLDEATTSSFVIAAIDNDTNSDNEVNYAIFDNSGLVTIDNKTGIITITSIDGQPDKEKYFDEIDIDVIAYYPENPTLASFGEIILIFDDIDDNVAKINQTFDSISVERGCERLDYLTSALDSDLTEEFTTYSIDLIVPDKVKAAFDVFPKTGERLTSIVVIVNCTQFDFNDPELENFEIELRTTGTKSSKNVDSLPIRVYSSGAINLDVNLAMILLLICWMTFS